LRMSSKATIRALLILFALFLPGCPNYNQVAERNRVPFKTEAEAQAAGYRKARKCPQ
jgi:hypothetical protein